MRCPNCDEAMQLCEDLVVCPLCAYNEPTTTETPNDA